MRLGVVIAAMTVPVYAQAVNGMHCIAEEKAAVATEKAREQLERLAGQRVSMTDDGYIIEDIAGEGVPRVGVIERRGPTLWLRTAACVYRLSGPLAKPRIAGPGYFVWVLGRVEEHAGTRILYARRLGVLAPPWAQYVD